MIYLLFALALVLLSVLVVALTREPKPLDVEYCSECHHLVRRRVMQEVETDFEGRPLLYCPEHQKPYHRVSTDYKGRSIYWREVAVDADGEPKGYVKADAE